MQRLYRELGDGDSRRGAGRLGPAEFSRWGEGMRFREAGIETLGRRSCHPRSRICPLRGGYSAAAVVIAAARAPDGKLVRFPHHGVAFVRRADTAGMG